MEATKDYDMEFYKENKPQIYLADQLILEVEKQYKEDSKKLYEESNIYNLDNICFCLRTNNIQDHKLYEIHNELSKKSNQKQRELEEKKKEKILSIVNNIHI